MSRTIVRSFTAFALALVMALGLAAVSANGALAKDYSYKGVPVGSANITVTPDITYDPAADSYYVDYTATFTPDKGLYDYYKQIQSQVAPYNVNLSDYVVADQCVITATIEFPQQLEPMMQSPWYTFDGLGILQVNEDQNFWNASKHTLTVQFGLTDDWASHIDDAVDGDAMKTLTFRGQAKLAQDDFVAGTQLVTEGGIEGTFVDNIKDGLNAELGNQVGPVVYSQLLREINQKFGTNLTDIPATKTVEKQDITRTTDLEAFALTTDNATVTVPEGDYVANGSALTPEPVVKVAANGKTVTLAKDADYTLAYADNDKPGTATVTAAGAGNYTGSASGTFEIAKPAPKSIDVAVVTVAAAGAYNGAAHTPAVTVKLGSETLKEGTDYLVDYASNVNAGTAVATVNGIGSYAGTATATFDIAKAANTMTAKGKTVSVKAKDVKKKAKKISAKKAFKVSKAQGKVTYKKASGNKKIAVSKSGKVTVKKGLKKGTYKVKVKVTAAGNGNYGKATKTVTLKIKVK